MLARFAWGTLYGIAFMFVTGVTLFSVLDSWPDPLMWLKIGTGLAAQFGLGVFTYMRDPERAWQASPGARVVVVLACLGLFAGCSGLGILQNPATDVSQQRAIMEQQNARGCIYFRANALPWASVTTLLVGTWGQEPPSYAECWKGLPPAGGW